MEHAHITGHAIGTLNTPFRRCICACLQWSKAVVDDQDKVKKFVEEYMLRTGNDEDRVERTQAWAMYKEINPEEKSANSKDKIGLHKFNERIAQHLPDMLSQLWVKSEFMSARKLLHNLWVGWQLKASS